jgi:hypothetical protein
VRLVLRRLWELLGDLFNAQVSKSRAWKILGDKYAERKQVNENLHERKV